MPGLLRAMAATAVVSGTAQATRNAVDRRQASKNVAAYGNAEQQYAQQQAPPPQPVYAAPPAAAPAAMSQDDKFEALERLGALKAQGILTEEEFTQQKAQILNS